MEETIGLGAVHRAVTKGVYLCILSVLWVICSIPVVTFGAATAALHTVTLKMAADEEKNIIASYFAAFRSNFMRATGLWLILLIIGIILVGDLVFVSLLGTRLMQIAFALFSGMLFVLALVASLAFHLQAFADLPLKELLKTGLALSLKHMHISLSVLLVLAAMLYGAYVSVPMLMILGFFGIGLHSYIASFLWLRILREHIE